MLFLKVIATYTNNYTKINKTKRYDVQDREFGNTFWSLVV